MSREVICAGHICIDITPVFDESREFSGITDLLEPGKLIYMNGVNVHTGGSVANTGLAMKLLGCSVRLMGKTGDDAFGGIIRDILRQYGAGGLLVQPGAVTSYSVVLAIPGMDRIFLHDPGANDSFSDEDIPWEELGETVLFHFGYPTLMKKMYSDNGNTLSALFRRLKEKGIATSLDLAAVDPQSPSGQADWEQILARTLPYVDFFVPSFEELCWMLDRKTWEGLSSRGKDMTDSLDLQTFAKPLAERCLELGCGTALLKCGISGMYYKTAQADRISRIGSRLEFDRAAWTEREGIQPCFEAGIVRSASGSGDASVAAFLTALLSGETPERCAAFAAAEGAASVTAYDALGGILPLEELDRRIRAGWETKK